MLGAVCISLVWGWMIGWIWRMPHGWRGVVWAVGLTAVVWAGLVALVAAMRWEEVHVLWWNPIAGSVAGWVFASALLGVVRERQRTPGMSEGGFHA